MWTACPLIQPLAHVTHLHYSTPYLCRPFCLHIRRCLCTCSSRRQRECHSKTWAEPSANHLTGCGSTFTPTGAAASNPLAAAAGMLRAQAWVCLQDMQHMRTHMHTSLGLSASSTAVTPPVLLVLLGVGHLGRWSCCGSPQRSSWVFVTCVCTNISFFLAPELCSSAASTAEASFSK